MKMKWGKTLLTTAMAIGVTMSAQAGNMIVTGHDVDEHSASSYFDWGMNYLMTGDGTGFAADNTLEASISVAFLGNTNRPGQNGGYNVDFYDLDSATWTDAFSGGYDVIVIGSGQFTVTTAGSASLNGQSAAFESYFNNGGNLFVNTEQGAGASFYDFLPAFGATQNASLPGCSSGAPDCMRATAEGAAVGMSDAIINEANITHTRFLNVDPAFTVLEEYYNNGGAGSGDAITIGFSGTIQCDPADPTASCYVPPVTGVPEASSVALLGLGLFGLGFTRRKNKSA